MIEVDALTFTYPGAARPALQDVTFTVAAGEIFGLLGPSGAGKSTTQNILIKLLSGYDGRITVFGRPLKTWGADYYERVGVTFEQPNHYLKLTGLENLTYFRALYRGETLAPREVLDRVGLGPDAHRPVGHYSKGMRSRLTLARAMLHKPRLLFLDEPTSGLDPGLARAMRDVIRGLREEGATILLTTHDMTVADDLCDRIGFIVDGRIDVIDSPETLKLAHGNRTVRVTWGGQGGPQDAVFALDGLATNPGFQDLLHRVRIETIHSQEPSLEDVFIQVTGRDLS